MLKDIRIGAVMKDGHVNASGMLSQAQLAQYHEDGFVIPDFQLPEHVLEEIRGAHSRLIAKHPEFEDYCPAVLAYDTWFLGVARIPEILEMVGQVLGPDFALWNSSIFAKPAHKGRRTPWHQDGEYWPIRPLANCTVWIAVDDSTRENGCLQVVRGSHKARRLFGHHTTSAPDVTLDQELDEIDETQVVDLVLKAGQMSLHDIFLSHGSDPNRSDKPRRGMTLRYMPTTSKYDREVAALDAARRRLIDHGDRTLYLMRGQDACGQNDFVVRR